MGDASAKPIRVFILDDHEMVRRGVHACLDAEEGIEVVGEAATAESAIVRVPVLDVDVAVLDVQLADGSGIEACREIRAASPGTACLMLTGHSDDQALVASVMAGAAGYVTKLGLGDELVEAVRAVATGRSVLGPEATQRLMARIRSRTGAADPLAVLSAQEKRVLELVGEGLTNRDIAARMFLSEKTVKNYMSSVLSKLGMQRRSQVAVLAARIGPPGGGTGLPGGGTGLPGGDAGP